MGYRSDVMALVYPATELSKEERTEKYAVLKTLVNTTYRNMWEAWESCFEWVDRDEVLKFACSDVKWYPSYTDIAVFEQFMDSVGDCGYDTEFVRIGEDYSDIETTYSDTATYHLSVRRAIESEV